jgi:catechol 2,3-dioxygenase-like lactoylglutathione lyase family enzyme
MPHDQLVRFHLSLNVADLTKSVAFYRNLFGQEPAKLRDDYAKFEPDSPPLVLSLEPTPRPTGGPLNHVGIRLPDSKSLVELQSRLEANGVRCNREEGVECCYAKQTKFWLHDPDGTLWELYTLDEDIDHRGMGQSQETVLLGAPSKESRIEWEHRLGEPLPETIPLDTASADEIRLRGTFNLPLEIWQRQSLLRETSRALKPGGRLFVHVLTGERTVDAPQLPGPASVVRHVPFTQDVLGLIEATGLTRIRLLKFNDQPCFVRDGVAMRETQIEAWR